MRAALLSLALLLALPGCSLFLGDRSDQIACTLEFRTFAVRVVDADGEPVSGLATTVTNTRTGEVLTSEETLVPGDGRYVVVTDAHTDALSTEGDPLTFHAEGQGLTAEASFVVSGGPCHVAKRSGPDEIVAGPSQP